MWMFANCSSKLFNPKLAEIFFKSEIIEAGNRGFDKISEACAKNNSPLPEYIIADSGITVCCNAGEDYIRLLDDNVTNNVTSKKVSTEDKTILLIKECPDISTQEIAGQIGISKRTVLRNIKTLKEKGILVRCGSNTKGYWKLNN